MSNEDDELEINHRVVIEEEDIDVSELPVEIKAEMRKFNAKLEEYEETGDAELFFELQQDDIAIADAIQTFIEDMEADDDEEEEEEQEEQEEEEEEDEIKNESQKQAQPQPQASATPAISQIEQAVRNSIKDGKISVDDLERIIKREPDYPNEQVGNLILKKQYLKPFYEVYEK